MSRVHYIKYIDIWFLVSTFFIFLSLVEFAIVNSIQRGNYPVSRKTVKALYGLLCFCSYRPRGKDRFLSDSITKYKLENYDKIIVSFSYENKDDFETSSIDSTDFTEKSRSLKIFNFSLGNSLDKRDIAEEKNNLKKKTEQERERDHKLAELIDRQARIFFPLSWIIFMLLYFFYLAEIHKEVQPINNVPLSN